MWVRIIIIWIWYRVVRLRRILGSLWRRVSWSGWRISSRFGLIRRGSRWLGSWYRMGIRISRLRWWLILISIWILIRGIVVGRLIIRFFMRWRVRILVFWLVSMGGIIIRGGIWVLGMIWVAWKVNNEILFIINDMIYWLK